MLVFWGPASDKWIFGADIGVSAGVGESISVGRSYTWVNQSRSGLVANPARWARDHYMNTAPWGGNTWDNVGKVMWRVWLKVKRYKR